MNIERIDARVHNRARSPDAGNDNDRRAGETMCKIIATYKKLMGDGRKF